RLRLYVDEPAVFQADEQLIQPAVADADATEGEGVQQLVAQDAALQRRRVREAHRDFDLLGGHAGVFQAPAALVARRERDVLDDITDTGVEVGLGGGCVAQYVRGQPSGAAAGLECVEALGPVHAAPELRELPGDASAEHGVDVG